MKCGAPILALAALLAAAGAAFGQARVIMPAAPPASPPSAPAASTGTSVDSALKDLTEYLDRSSKLKDDDVDGRLSLARWAVNREMYSQAVEMADEVLYREPGNRIAYTILQQVDDARPLPDEPEVEKKLKEEMKDRFKHDFKTRNARHFIMVYDSTDAFAAQRGAVMEKTYDAFRFYFNMNTLHPDFLENRLVVLLLKDREDYLTYGKQTEGVDFSWSAGYYSQRTNRSAFYDDASGPTAASFAKQTAGLKSSIDALNQQIAAARGENQLGMVNTLTVERNRDSETLSTLANRLGNQVQMNNNSKTMHETAHQVSFNLGIQSRLVDYPMWFSEGLACSFEFEDGAGHRGPALVNPGRLMVVKEALRDNTMIPLDTFITADPPDKNDQKAMGLEYAEGWALFHYLYKFNRQGMEEYLLAYKMHKPLRPIGADERKVIFTKAFGGDLDELNKKFLAYLKGLPGKAN